MCSSPDTGVHADWGRAMLMRLFNDEEEVVDSTNKNRARPRVEGGAAGDEEVLPDADEPEVKGDEYGSEEPGAGEPVGMSAFEEVSTKVPEEGELVGIVKAKAEEREVGALKKEVMGEAREARVEAEVGKRVVEEEVGEVGDVVV